jgi:tetratricopeptide (TPR) repeat protein
LVILGLTLFAQDDQARREYFARDAQRNQLWQKGQYAQAVFILEEMSRNATWNKDRNLRINTLYNLACGYSVLGRKEDAVKTLRETVQLGFSNVQHVRTEKALDNTRNEPGFRELLAAMDRHARFWDSPAFSKPYSENLTEAEKIAGLSRFWSEVKCNFPFFDKLPISTGMRSTSPGFRRSVKPAIPPNTTAR